jgi:chromatin remodeling complex protein RSC6
MSSTEIVEPTLESKVETSSEQLRTILATITEHSSQVKNLMNSVRAVLRDVERQGKELDKFRNKKSRNSTERKLSGVPSGITKPVAISDELARFLGVEPGTLVPRNEVTKGVSSYVRKFELSDPANRQKFVLSSKPEGAVLKSLLGSPTEEVTYFNLQRYLKHHYIQLSSVPEKSVEVKPEVVSSAVEPEEKPKVKKIIKVVKKKTESSQLSEE